MVEFHEMMVHKVLSNRLILKKTKHRMVNYFKHTVGRLAVQFNSTDLSDADFLKALNSKNHWVSIDECAPSLKVRYRPPFFIDPKNRQERVALVDHYCPDARRLIISAANRICDHRFDLLGSGDVLFSEGIDWHVDFKSGYHFDPHMYYYDINPAQFPGGYEIKTPWELSRCQHFVWLGQAYWLTGDEKYVLEFTAQLEDWIYKNPPRLGVNWNCTMDVAIRVVNWIMGYAYFCDSPLLSKDFLIKFFKSLLVHGRHIRLNLEGSETFTNNHYLSNIVGLVYLGFLFPEFSEANQWLTFGLSEMEREMFKQVYADGVDFEASTSYHRMALEMFLSVTLLADLQGIMFSHNYMVRLEKMLEFTLAITKPDGTVSLVGDNDNGRLHRLKVWEEPDREWIDHRYLLAIGAVLFKRLDLAIAAQDQWEEAFWLWGNRVSELHKRANSINPMYQSSCAFSDAGIYVMRHEDIFVLVDAGKNGQNGIGGHAHNDILSFELFAYGQSWLIDTGTFVYTSDYELRHRFRSTAYHNTVMIDGKEQISCSSRYAFRMLQEINVKVIDWYEDGKEVILEAEHDGYKRLPGGGFIHRRKFILNKKEKRLKVQDFITGTPVMPYIVSNLHFPPGIWVEEMLHEKVIIASAEGLPTVLKMEFSPVRDVVIESQACAYGYGKKASCLAVKYLPMDMIFEMDFSFQ